MDIISTKGVLDYLLFGTVIVGNNLYHLNMTAYSVRLALGLHENAEYAV